MQRTDIRAIRQIYQHVQTDIDAHRLLKRHTAVACENQGNWEAEITVYADAAGHVRRLSITGGGEDSAEAVDYTYDSNGRLRFALSKRGAVNGSHAEQRAYWDTSGQLLYRDDRLLEGEGYPWADIEPIWVPLDWLRDPCK